jgi:hypothetical protein
MTLHFSSKTGFCMVSTIKHTLNKHLSPFWQMPHKISGLHQVELILFQLWGFTLSLCWYYWKQWIQKYKGGVACNSMMFQENLSMGWSLLRRDKHMDMMIPKTNFPSKTRQVGWKSLLNILLIITIMNYACVALTGCSYTLQVGLSISSSGILDLYPPKFIFHLSSFCIHFIQSFGTFQF